MACFDPVRINALFLGGAPQGRVHPSHSTVCDSAKIQTYNIMRLGLFGWRQVVRVGRWRRRCTSGGGVSLIQPPLCPRILRHTHTHKLTRSRRSQCQLARVQQPRTPMPDLQVSPIEKLPTSQPLDKNAPALLSFSFCAQKSNVSSLNGYKAISKIGFFESSWKLITRLLLIGQMEVLPLRDYCSGHFTI